MNKIVKLGTFAPNGTRRVSVYCKIELNNGNLSISGVEGPLSDGNCLGSCGQINMHLCDRQSEIKLAKGWTPEMLARFFAVWDRWHLNDLRAGTPEQMAELARHTFPGYPKSHYEWACEVLSAVGLLDVPTPTAMYRYGSAWLTEPVPADVIGFLESLPESDTKPAWV